jgi:hypothetical protein
MQLLVGKVISLTDKKEATFVVTPMLAWEIGNRVLRSVHVGSLNPNR